MATPSPPATRLPRRLLTALLLLGAVFAMHGLSCVGTADAGTGHPAPAPAPAPATVLAAAPGHGMAAAGLLTALSADPAPVHSADGPVAADHADHAAATVAPAADHGSAPHGSAAHLWGVCLAVLAAGLAAMLAVFTRRLLGLVAPALSRALTRARGLLPLPRPPDLHALCLLRT